MKGQRADVAGAGVWMTRMLRLFAAISATVGVILVATGVLENAGGKGVSGAAPIGIGLVMLIAALAALAPIASTRVGRAGTAVPEKADPPDPPQ